MRWPDIKTISRRTTNGAYLWRVSTINNREPMVCTRSIGASLLNVVKLQAIKEGKGQKEEYGKTV
jgi:hypothetical protein